jgi:NAD(P)-dependent dehydrogenase (short-subunit alcohol dehydrogenase family)
VLAVNLTGPFYVCRQFLTAMLANRFGRIINISSIQNNGGTGQGNYAASKAGLHGLSKTLAKELSKHRYLRRQRDPNDGRAQLLSPAKRALDLREDLFRLQRLVNSRVRRDIADADIDRLIETLALLAPYS